MQVQNKVDRGYLSHNFILTNKNQKFFLKQYRHTDKNKVQQIINIVHFFQSRGIPTIEPLTNEQNEKITTIGNKHFGLFPYIDKKEVNRGEVNKQMVKSMAETLAQIHKIGQKDDLPEAEKKNISWSKDKLDEKAKQVKKVITDKDKSSQYDQLAQRTIEAKLKLAQQYPIQPDQLDLEYNCLIHGDFHCENVFLNEQNKVAYVYDWDKAKMAPRCWEVIRSLIYTIFNKKYNKQKINQAQLYLKTYQDNYKLTNEQVETGVKAIALNNIYSMWVLEEYYLKDNKRVKSLLEAELKRIQFFGEGLNKVVERFKV
ncbi:MAG: phosphotransferase [Candidatus Magasanikbacteria bacterium]